MMDGFRKGKVPQNLAEKTQGFEKLYRSYIDELITSAIENVNKQHNVTVMDLQQIYPEKLDKTGIVMQAVAYLKPSVLELDYQNLTATKQDSEPTETEVNTHIEGLREQNALVIPVTNRPVQFGDTVVMSYTGSQKDANGRLVPFAGGSASRQTVTLLEGSFIPGFGEQVVGMNLDESKTFTVTFPENYHATNLAGKEASFDLTIHEVKTRNLPALDDEFAQIYNKATFAELKASIADSIRERKQAFNQTKTETEICLELVRRAKISPLPQTMVQKRLDTLLAQEAGNVGMASEEYLKQRKLDRATFDRGYYNIALRDLKVQLVLDYIATKENLEASAEELASYVSSEADRLGYTVEQISTMATMEQLNAQVRLRKAYDYLLSVVTYTE
jgi:trigger factor